MEKVRKCNTSSQNDVKKKKEAASKRKREGTLNMNIFLFCLTYGALPLVGRSSGIQFFHEAVCLPFPCVFGNLAEETNMFFFPFVIFLNIVLQLLFSVGDCYL